MQLSLTLSSFFTCTMYALINLIIIMMIIMMNDNNNNNDNNDYDYYYYYYYYHLYKSRDNITTQTSVSTKTRA